MTNHAIIANLAVPVLPEQRKRVLAAKKNVYFFSSTYHYIFVEFSKESTFSDKFSQVLSVTAITAFKN
jgi:hypothetical protein